MISIFLLSFFCLSSLPVLSIHICIDNHYLFYFHLSVRKHILSSKSVNAFFFVVVVFSCVKIFLFHLFPWAQVGAAFQPGGNENFLSTLLTRSVDVFAQFLKEYDGTSVVAVVFLSLF